MSGGDCGEFNRQCGESAFQFVRKFRVVVIGKLSRIYSKSNVTVPRNKCKHILLSRKATEMGKDSSWNDYSRRVSKVIFAFVEYIFQVLFGLVYGGGTRESMPPIRDLLLLESASTIAMKIRTGKITSEQVLDSFIERIKEVNPVLNCVVADRFNEAREEAQEVDQLIQSQRIPQETLAKEKPFLGVPFTTKDCIPVKGLIHSSGLFSRKHIRAESDAAVISLLRKAGAIPIGLTNVSELCMWWESSNNIHGRTNNPYDTSRIVGGSSGGEGCAQASASSAFGIGSDIGGSIRMPAFFNGIFGHMPTPLTVPLTGQYPAPISEEQTKFLRIGPMCRRAEDLLPLLKVITSNLPQLRLDEPVDIKDIKIYYQETDGGSKMVSAVSADIRELFGKISSHLEKAHGIKANKVSLKRFIKSGPMWFANMKASSGPTFVDQLANLDGKINPWWELFKWIFGKSNHSFIALATCLIEKGGCRYISCARVNYNQVETENGSQIVPDETAQFRSKLLNGPNLKDFFKDEHLKQQDHLPDEEVVPYLIPSMTYGEKRKVFFEVYGCQMNVNDTEIIWSILKKSNYEKTNDLKDADVILIVTCAIRDSAEERIWGRLNYIKGIKKVRSKNRPSLKIGILGCMAERLKEKVLETDKSVDVVVGPDAYRDLPRLLALTSNDQKSVNVMLSFDETYADITPIRLNENSVSAFVSIMRGCDNMCTYCIVPFTRGRERSRPVSSILKEVEHLSENGVKEITLLGQNVNSYRDTSENDSTENITSLAKGFKTVYKLKKGGLRFADLLHRVSEINPELRVRFTSPHPKDFPDEVIDMIQGHSNICKNLHMPAQSGNSAVLERMRRGYTRETYLELVAHIRKRIPDVALTSDFICGFCAETDEEFEDTITLMEEVKYHSAFVFPYSMREKTTAHRRFQDDVPQEVKLQRLQRMIEVYRRNSYTLNCAEIGNTHLVLIEGFSRRSDNFFQGRNDNNIKVILPATDHIPSKDGQHMKLLKPGDYVAVHINAASSQVLKGIPLYYSGLQEYYQNQGRKYPDDRLSFEN